jgi:hypothetical protein
MCAPVLSLPHSLYSLGRRGGADAIDFYQWQGENRYGWTRSPFSSLGYHQLSHPFSYSLALYTTSIIAVATTVQKQRVQYIRSGLTLSLSFSIPAEEAVWKSDHTAYVTAYKQMDDPTYFTKDYCNNNQFVVRSCAKCEIELDGKTVPVYACELAANTNLPCMHAFCAPCLDKIKSLAPPTARTTQGGTISE